MKNPFLSLVVIRSADINAAVNFYRALGLVFVMEQHGTGPVHYSSIMNDLVFEIYPLVKNGSFDSPGKDSAMLGLSVESLETVLAELSKIGIIIENAPRISEWGRWIKIYDPDGRPVRVTEIPR